MSKEYVLHAEAREDQGKGASRRLRRTGGVPAIVYGASQEPTTITLQHSEVVRNLNDEAFYSQMITLKTGDASETVVLRDLQRHPAKPFIMHVDLQRVEDSREIRMLVPLHVLNGSTSMGVKTQGGRLNQIMGSIEIMALPKDVPSYLEVDMLKVEKGGIVHLSDVILPEGVRIPELAIGDDHNQPVAAIH